MSIYDDDGFDEEAAELSEAITGSYTGSGGGQQTGFSFDDGGDSGVNVTLGTSDPRGGTSITGNVIRGGTIFGRTPSQQARQQRLSGMGDYRNSEAYQRYKTETGRSLQNPYGNTGLFSGIFGADRVNYNMDPVQAQNLLDIGFDRYMNFDQQPEYAQSRGFGKLVGGPEGEMTAQGELRAQVPETTTAESLLRSIIPGASFLPTPGTTYAPMGSTSYDPERDPSANQDLRSGPFSLLTDVLSKGREFISDRLNPLPDAPPSRPRAPVQETREDIRDTRTPAPLTPEQEVAQMAMYEAEPLYPNMTNYGKREPDLINPLAIDFLDNINLGQFGEIIEKARSGDLLSTQTPFGQLSFEPEFKGSRPVGGMIRLKGQF